MKSYLTIEQNSRGATYRNSNDTWTVYEIRWYPRSSVLAGQQRRVWVEIFNSLEEAKEAFPDAEVSGCTYREPYLEHLGSEDEGDLY